MKVFSRKSWLECCQDMSIILVQWSSIWVDECEGKTKEECKEMGYLTSDEWFIEKEKMK